MMKKRVVIRYLGYGEDVGGILNHIRKLSPMGEGIRSMTVVKPSFVQTRSPCLKLHREKSFGAEVGSVWTAMIALPIAIKWALVLRKKPHYFFHGHSRLGFFIVLWLHILGCQRILTSVHCYGKTKWLYRWADERLKHRIVFLSLDMRRYYGVSAEPDKEATCLAPPMPLPLQQVKKRIVNTPLTAWGLGALEYRKGWHLVIEALKQMPQELKTQIQFMHFGNDNERDYADKCRLSSRSLGDRVIWRGWSPAPWREDEYLPDLIILPSIDEPFSNVGLEAASFGIAVLTADRGGIASLVSSGCLHGFSFRQDDASSLAEVLSELVRNPQLLVQESYDTTQLLKQFGIPRTIKRWKAYYDSVEVMI